MLTQTKWNLKFNVKFKNIIEMYLLILLVQLQMWLCVVLRDPLEVSSWNTQ